MRVFLASSTESIPDMRALARIIEKAGHTPVVWDAPGVFIAGQYTFQRILEISRDVQAAAFIFGEDDKVWYRDSELQQPRDNVLVEYGVFAGVVGPGRALICRKGKAKTPGDLDGILHLPFGDAGLGRKGVAVREWLGEVERLTGVGRNTRLSYTAPDIAADNRDVLDREYRERKYAARDVDVLGIALSGVLDELATDDSHVLLDRVILQRARVRLIFVSPESVYVEQRAREDGVTRSQLIDQLRRSVLRVGDIKRRLEARIDAARDAGVYHPSSVGSLEIRVTDFCPHFTVYRTDDAILWGLYTAARLGLHSSVLRVARHHGALFDDLLEHFNCLWALDPAEHTLLQFHRNMDPSHNDTLSASLSSVV